MKVRILGFGIDNMTMEETLTKIEDFVSGRGCNKLTFPNPHILLEARKNLELDRFIATAGLVLPDGVGVLLASKLLGQPIKERVTGSDFINNLSELAARKGWRIYFLGAEEGVAKRAAEILRGRHPGLQIVGIRHGYFSEDEEGMIVEDIIAKGPDILIVCLGAGKQEMFIERNLRRMNIPLSFGNGAAFDFVAGKVRRAPKWMQLIGLEWFFRLLQEPKRLWKRYLIGNAVFLWLVLKESVKRRNTIGIK